ncbi:MAG TPA: hypothetical protein DGX96_07250, partial [Lachnospiraceae bacterium]|nr:hypothetical protein [Lachnospiraceae bacterium]
MTQRRYSARKAVIFHLDGVVDQGGDVRRRTKFAEELPNDFFLGMRVGVYVVDPFHLHAVDFRQHQRCLLIKCFRCLPDLPAKNGCDKACKKSCVNG